VSVRGRIMAAVYDRLAATSEREGMADRRRNLLAAAHGRVLEVGAGTGLNLEHYPNTIEELVLVEPERAMARKLVSRVTEVGRPARIVEASAETLPFGDSSFDTVVCTLVLCSVGDPEAGLRELRRVLRPGGSFLFLEHVRSGDARTARRQDRLNPIWRFIGNGCNCNRRTLGLIEAEFCVDEVEEAEMPRAPSIVRPLVIGRATPCLRSSLETPIPIPPQSVSSTPKASG
jgi:ubiquinone/menaquinone biosynthesis C-methylase UbiE